MSDRTPYTRRAFLSKGLTVVSATVTMPWFLEQSALALNNPFEYRNTSSRPGDAGDRILVVVQLSGGNDGLNTVVPYGHADYYRLRGGLAVRESNALKLSKADGFGLHPQMAAMRELYDEGLVAPVLGVGYPNPNRSHFKSMDIWHTAKPDAPQGAGWIGRYFDNDCAGAPEPDACVAVGDQAPLATQGQKVQPVAFENEKLFRWAGAQLHPDLAKAYQQANRAGAIGGTPADSPAAFLMRTSLDAQVSSERIRKAAATTPLVSYPGHALARQLKLVASMIRAGLGTRVYYVSMGGFDTHAGQAQRHANLLRQFSESVRAFHRDLKTQGNSGRVLVMSFSEFGRRPRANASGGTDHGTAAPMFLVGDMVKPGVHGKQPSLKRLDRNGDLIYSTDFRSIYATVLSEWLTADSAKVLGKKYPTLPVLRART